MDNHNYNSMSIEELALEYESLVLAIKELESNKALIAPVILEKIQSSNFRASSWFINVKTKVTPKVKDGVTVPQEFIKTKVDEQALYKFDPSLCTISSTTFIEYRQDKWYSEN